MAGRGRVVRATQIIKKGKYVCNFDGLVLEPEACKTFFYRRQKPTVLTQYWGGQNIAWFSNSMEGNMEKDVESG